MIGTVIAYVTHMVLRIDKSKNSEFVIFALSGRIEINKTTELREILASQEESQKIAFDLRDVTLVDQASVEFLAEWQAKGAELWNCPVYLREWIERLRSFQV